MQRSIWLLCALLVATGLSTTCLQAQKGTKKWTEKYREDPYTKNEQKAIEAAGYVRYHPFHWADQHGTERIEKALGKVKIRWIETPHFRIGSSLKTISMPKEKDPKKALKAELKELKKTLPTVKPSPKKIDPWLRAHLYAYRLEKLYADLQKLCCVTDESFPKEKGQLVNGTYMGDGPYFGAGGKYLVMLMDKGSTIQRYMTTFAKRPAESSAVHYFVESDSMYFGTAAEFGDDTFKKDPNLHSHVIFNMTHSLLDGYKGYRYQMPFWWKEGLAHWYSRRAFEEQNNFTKIQNSESERTYKISNWDVQCYRRLDHDLMPKLSTYLDNFDYTAIGLVDHMANWSRVDYLLTLGDEKFAVFIDMMKSIEPGGRPDKKTIVEVQARAIQKAWGLTPDALDLLWKKHIKKHYPRK